MTQKNQALQNRRNDPAQRKSGGRCSYFARPMALALLMLLLLPVAGMAIGLATEFTGKVESKPLLGLLGSWKIDGRTVVIGPTAELKTGLGELVVGACVEVEGVILADGRVQAVEIEVKADADCGPGGGEDGEEPELEPVKFKGVVEFMAGGTLLGEWIVSGRTVSIGASTELEAEAGPFEIGACVEVKGTLGVLGVVNASEVETKAPGDCGLDGGDSPEISLENRIKFDGVVEARPEASFTGQWMISGLGVTVNGSTEIDASSGPLTVGACVEVTTTIASNGTVTALELQSQSPAECGGDDILPRVDFEGQVSSLPIALLLGVWVVGDIDVEILGSTEIEQNAGPIALGACVEGEGTLEANGSITATEVKVRSSLGGCNFQNPQPEEIEFYGLIQVLPEGGVEGVWRISGRTVVVDGSVEIDIEGEPEIGDCILVEGTLTADGVVVVSRIRTDTSEAPCGTGSPDAAEVEFKGVIETLPIDDSLMGEWLVSGQVVIADETTELEAENGLIEVGACVEVHGRLTAAGAVEAREIETEEPGDCPAPPAAGVSLSFMGLVQAAPDDAGSGEPGMVAQLFAAAGLTTQGTWRIGQRDVEVGDETMIDQTDGELNVGACVSIKGQAMGSGFQAATITVLSSSGVCIAPGGIVNGASFEAQAVSPGQVIAVFGLGIGPATDASLEVVGGRLTAQLSSTRIYFDGVAARLIFVSSNQVNVIVPYSVEGQATTLVQVERGGAWSNVIELEVASAAPGIFTLTQTGRGQAAALNVETDGSLTINGAANPVSAGNVIVLYATGEGQTNPGGVDGQIAAAGELTSPVQPVVVVIGGIEAQVLYAGSASGLVQGVMQVNAVVPAGATAGAAVPCTLFVGGSASQQTTIAVE